MNRDDLTERQLGAVLTMEMLAAHTAHLRQLHERGERERQAEKDARWHAHRLTADRR